MGNLMRSNLEQDFEAFVEGRSPSLLRAAVLLVGGRDDAQDLVQQALWRTHRHWRDASNHPEAYARKVLVNLAHDRRRNSARRVREVALETVREPGVSDGSNPVVERDALMRALQALPVRQRATLVLRFWEGMSVDETAGALECSTGTVKSNTSRALHKLRGILDQQSRESTEETGSKR